MAVSWGQAWEQGNFLHPQQEKALGGGNDSGKAPGEGSFLFSWDGAQLPPFPPSASFISHSPEQNSAFPLLRNSTVILSKLSTVRAHFHLGLQLGLQFVCWAVSNLSWDHQTAFLVALNLSPDGGGMAWVTFHRSRQSCCPLVTRARNILAARLCPAPECPGTNAVWFRTDTSLIPHSFIRRLLCGPGAGNTDD